MANKYTHKHLIRIAYNSGNIIEAWFYEFEFNGANRKATWDTASLANPLFINLSEIESIWQIDSVELAEGEGPQEE